MKKPSPAQQAALLRRAQASQYLLKAHGLTRAPATLASDACRGIGAEIEYVNKVPHYRPAALDAYAKALVGKPTRQARKYPQPRNPAGPGPRKVSAELKMKAANTPSA